MNGHTPTPWELDWTYKTNVYSHDATGSLIANCGPHTFVHRSALECEANAAFIVKAANAWYDLEALKARVAELEARE